MVTWCTNRFLTFNNCTFCPHCFYVFCIYLRTNSYLCHLQHKKIPLRYWTTFYTTYNPIWKGIWKYRCKFTYAPLSNVLQSLSYFFSKKSESLHKVSVSNSSFLKYIQIRQMILSPILEHSQKDWRIYGWIFSPHKLLFNTYKYPPKLPLFLRVSHIKF